MRFSKQKGGAGALEAHHERKKEKYASNPDIDPSRKHRNFHIIEPTTTYKCESDNRIAAAQCKTRKDSIRFVDTLVTASPDFFKGKKRSEIKEFFATAVDFLSQKIGKENIFAAVVHMDEKTPHLHLCFTPITPDGRLSAKEIIGNRTQLSKWQDDFFAHMVQKFPDLERGEPASITGRQHIPMRVFKQAVNLEKQAAKIAATIADISAFNCGKKKEELLGQLQKFMPNWEQFEGQVKKYRRTIDFLADQNADLKQEVKDSKLTLTEKMDYFTVKRNYEQTKQILRLIPEDIRKEAADKVFRPQKSKTKQLER